MRTGVTLRRIDRTIVMGAKFYKTTPGHRVWIDTLALKGPWPRSIRT
jgi:hypothetical protein